MRDIVVPGNEKALIDMAIRLKYDELLLLYPNKREFKSEKIKIRTAVISKKPQKGAVLKAEDVRKALEAGPMILYDIETSEKNDFIHHRNSGLNQVMAKIAKEKGVSIGIAFKTILNSKKEVMFGRIMQNIRICRKYKVPIKIFSLASDPYDMRSPHDLMSFLIDMGMHPSEAKKALL